MELQNLNFRNTDKLLSRKDLLNCNNISHKLIDGFDKMGFTQAVTDGLNSCSPILTIFGHTVAYFKRTIRTKFYTETLIGV